MCVSTLRSCLPLLCCCLLLLLLLQAFSGIVLSAFFAGYAATQVLGGTAHTHSTCWVHPREALSKLAPVAVVAL
jgi:hypothetical protein